MKLVFATSNAAKAKRFTNGLKKYDIEVITLKDLSLSLDVIENGNTPIENASIKAKACFNKTHMPTIGMDDSLYLEGVKKEDQPGLFVRRVNAKTLNDEEMIEHYTNLVKKHGKDGKLNCKWVYGLSVIDANGKESTITWNKDDFYMVDTPSKIINKGYPLNSISKFKEIDKYFTEIEKSDYEKLSYSEDDIIDFIAEHILKK